MKKLLVATSALVVAAPAFADGHGGVTISGQIDLTSSTEDGQKLTTMTLDSLTLSISAAGDLGGNLTLGINTSGSIDLTDFDSYASTSIGKFNFGTSTGAMTDDDITEMNEIGDTGTVDFTSGVGGFTLNSLAALTTYSNTFGAVDAAVTWGSAGYILSLGGSAAGFTLDFDTQSGGTNDGQYVANVSGDVGPVGIILEVDQDNDYDAKLSGSFGGFGVALGLNNNEESELELTSSFGDIAAKLYAGTLTAGDFSYVSLTTDLAGYSTEFLFGENAGTSEASATVTVVDGLTIAYGGASGSEDLTFSLDMSF